MGAARILVISGNRGMARSVSTALRAKGYEAPVAGDEPTAMAMADAVTPRLIVIDLTSAGLMESSLISDIRHSPGLERTPIVVLTTRVDMPDRRVQASVLVPIDTGELLTAVAALLGEPEPSAPVEPPSHTAPPRQPSRPPRPQLAGDRVEPIVTRGPPTDLPGPQDPKSGA